MIIVKKVGILLFCSQCGKPLHNKDRFCGNCGAPTGKSLANPITIPKIPMSISKIPVSRRTKITSLVIGGITAIVLIVYGIAHATYGPSTPAELEGKIIEALSQGNTNQLAQWLDPGQSELKQQEVLEAFQKSLDETVRKRYETAVRNASASAGRTQKGKDAMTLFSDNSSMIQFVSHSNWRGTRWSFHVTPAQLQLQDPKDAKLNTRLTIGSLAVSEGQFPPLWPSVYTYDGEVSNPYAAENVSGTIDLITNKSRTMELAKSVKTKMVLRLPDLKGFTYQMNGIPVEASQPEIVISPAPKEAKLQAAGNVLGKMIDETMTVNSPQGNPIHLSDAINKGIGKIAVEVIYEAALSWAQASNAGDPSLLKAAKPDGAYYKDVAGDMRKPSDNKTTLIKVAVDPEAIRMKGNQITVDASEQYQNEKATSFFSTDKNSTASWTYTLEKMPDKDEWWVVSHSTNFWRNALNSKNAVIKNNPGVTLTES